MIKNDGSLVLYKFEGGKGIKNFQIINDKIREIMIVATNGPLSSFILEYYSKICLFIVLFCIKKT